MGVRGVVVIAEGEHLCMKMRGVRNHSVVVTMAHRGLMEQKELEKIFSHSFLIRNQV